MNERIKEIKEEDEDDTKSVTPEGREKDHQTPTSTKGKKGDKDKSEKGGKGRKTSAERKKPNRRTSMQSVSPPPGAPTPASETEGR